MKTYQTMYQNEIRALEITIRDQDGNTFAPDTAYFSVYDEDGVAVGNVPENQSAQVTNNTVIALIGTATTAQLGVYHIVWKIVKNSYTYYHTTYLEVLPII
jgi:hypothetical protein